MTHLPVECIETAVCMNTQDELCQEVRLTPRVPRVVQKSNSQYGLQDPQNPGRKIILGTFWEIGIIYCSCGRSMKSTRSPTEFDQNNRDVTSIPGYVIKKNRKRGAKHGASGRQKMYYQAKQMLKQGRQGKHRCHPTILSRRYGDEEYRKSLSATGWKEHLITWYDRIAQEKHIYKSTRAERIQIANNWILTANAEEGTQLQFCHHSF